MKIVIYSCFGMADALMASSIIKWLPTEAEITWIAEGLALKLLLPKGAKGYSYKRIGQSGDLSQLHRELKDERWDVGILTVPSANNEGLSLLKDKVENIVYFQPKYEILSRSLKHTIDVNCELVKEYFFTGTDEQKEASKSDDGYELAIEPKYNCNREGPPRVVMHVAAQNWFWRHKALPLSLYRDIAKYLRGEGYEVIVVGDSKQLPHAMQIAEKKDIYLDLPMEELVDLLSTCTAYVGNDCGPMHLCAAMKIPTFTFYSVTAPSTTGAYPPAHPRNVAFTSEAHCSPCYFKRSFVSCEDPICHRDGDKFSQFVEEWSNFE
jgi:ADP-heptose:LPS heptosyltransferase